KKIQLEEATQSRTVMHEVFEWVDCIVAAIVVVVILFTFIFRPVGIIGPSMKETLHQDDKIIISNFLYTPQRGDIIVISRNYVNEASNGTYKYDEPIIKRVIATENQVVDIDFEAGIVYVDHVALDEPYTRTLTTNKYDITFPIRISEGHIFVLGDNRAESLDSRSSQIGLVDERYVLGKALFRVYPFDQFGGLY
ncbi:MAG: signal peptidase I, partial [Oscillospiraceae bacterium]|nr:signal peptidase I [Oscillospiraceae bacterium]